MLKSGAELFTAAAWRRNGRHAAEFSDCTLAVRDRVRARGRKAPVKPSRPPSPAEMHKAMLRKDLIRPAKIAAGTADPDEVARFDELAEEWWKPSGKFKVVHAFNAARVGFIVEALAPMRKGNGEAPLAGLRIADIGCGAGLVSEPLAQAGSLVTAIDASAQNIAIARRHAAGSALAIEYRCALPEALVKEDRTFDAVLSLEVVEHVADVGLFLDTIAALVRPGGRLVIGTINRTPLSWCLAIVAAEYVLGWLPRGTHTWDRFVKPDETAKRLRALGFSQTALCGISFNPLTWKWARGRSTEVNYLQVFDRETSAPGAVEALSKLRGNRT